MIAAISSTPNNNSEGASLTGGASLGKNDFLKLLVAQLEHQDPLSPQEGQEFAAQLAQFSSLEQLTNVNDNLKAGQAFDLAMSNSSMINLIGKTVDAPGNGFELGEDETETLKFSLSQDSKAVTINVYDSTGVNVASLNIGALSSGVKDFAWSGKDAKGSQLPAGTYSFDILAQDATGNFIETQTFAAGSVTDIIFEETDTFAIVNGQKINVNQISKVSL
ncbi:MAG: flagellar hook capping FlgD N-terminal domain-containing protein [Nitrospinota bacterium]|nr:flagellar hook capping FlgD N-terminal domain-containing protein [Nitrospinota bacterium]